jgi:hypothetical protein
VTPVTEPATDAVPGTVAGTVLERGRAKAYRPLPRRIREAALRAGIEAYERGEFFEAHELLEPAWMGTDDPNERALHSGLIKVAAAYVHAVRGNAPGIGRNLIGARERLGPLAADPSLSPDAEREGIDLVGLVADVDARLARLADDPTDATIDPPAWRRSR